MTVKQKDTAFSLASEAEGINIRLGELGDLLRLLDNELEKGHMANKGGFYSQTNWFMNCFPACQSLLHSIRRELQNRCKELDWVEHGLYGLYNTEGNEQAKQAANNKQ